LEILDALELTNNAGNQRKVRKLNKAYPGPIVFPSKGGQPNVEKMNLLNWWQGLAEKLEESQQKQADRKATLQEQHNYGRSGKVLPGIAGHIKKRRT
jgi:hypothetical protein